MAEHPCPAQPADSPQHPAVQGTPFTRVVSPPCCPCQGMLDPGIAVQDMGCRVRGWKLPDLLDIPWQGCEQGLLSLPLSPQTLKMSHV